MKMRIFKSNNLFILMAILTTWPTLLAGQNRATNTPGTTQSVSSKEKQTDRKITGIVTDRQGEPLIGATVAIKGTGTGVITDVEGRYDIKVNQPNAVLQFQYIGYIPQQIKAGQQHIINITLEESQSQLEEVVVVGYGTRKKASLTGAISSIGSQDLEKVHGVTTSSMLAGKLPGLSFRQADGRPGAGSDIQIRNLGGDPLFVIDGIPQDKGAFDQLAPNDIESVTTLKDASAAIYGLRAANGVILITTKKGKENSAPTVTLNTYYGWQNWTRFPKGVNAYEWMLAKAEAQMNEKGSTDVTPEELKKWKDGTESGYQGFDWYDYIVQKNAPQASVNVNVSGGSGKTKYYVSLSHLNQDAAFKDYNYKRTNLQSNIETKIGNRFKVGVNINGRIETKKNPAVRDADPDDYWAPRRALLNNLPTERPFANDNPKYPNHTKIIETNWALVNYDTSGSYKYDLRVMQANLSAEYESYFVKGLTAKFLYSYQLADNMINNFEYAYDVFTYDKGTDTYNRTGGNDKANRERTQKKVFNTVMQAQLNYDRTFNKVHHVAATLVNERITYRTIVNSLVAGPNNNFIDLIQFDDMSKYTDTDAEQARIGYIARVNYDFADRYYVEFSGRYDASWKFIPSKRWSFFPSVSLGWRISEESFFKNHVNTNTISDLKLRGSYGVLGDDNIGGSYDYIPGYTNNSSVTILDGSPVTGIRDRGEPVTNISWLKCYFSNIGIDYSLFDGKLFGSFDYFYRKRDGLLSSRYDVLLPSEVGYSLPQENLNSDAHMGGEFAISYKNNAGDLGYTIGANISYSRRKYLDVYKPRFGNSLDWYRNSSENRWTDVYWGYETIGQFQSQEEINSYPINIDGKGNTTLLPGDFIPKDINNDGQIDTWDERPIGYENTGKPLPLFNGGLNIALDYKGFDFSADFSFASSYMYAPNWETKWPFQGGTTLVKATQFDNRWRHEDPYDVNSPWIAGDAPALRYNARDNVTWSRNLDHWRTNVTAFRLRSMELGYSLPKKWLSAVHIQKARVYVNTYNLFSIDNVGRFGVDPEIADKNGLQYPQNVLINVGANLVF